MSGFGRDANVSYWRVATAGNQRNETSTTLSYAAHRGTCHPRRRIMAQLDLFQTPRRPWNTGRIIGPKPPLKPKHIWGIRQQLKSAHRVRDLALFNCAIDAKLRGCDLVELRARDVAPGGALRPRATVIQQKTGRPVPFEITEPARDALSSWLHQ